MTIRRLHVPMLEPEDVIRHLGKEEKHWKHGRSAHALAQSWFRANSVPLPVKSVLSQHPVFSSVKLIDAFLEREVDLGTAGRPSQTDLLAIIGLERDIAVLAVEGKVDESFGQLVSDWLDGSTNKNARLGVLCQTLKLTIDQSKSLRYQLLHRACSAIYEAQRYRTKIAAIVVHSFCQEQSGFSDFQAFLHALGARGEIALGTVTGPFNLAGVSFYATWVQDRIVEPESAIEYLEDLKAYATRNLEWCSRVNSWCDQLLNKPKI